MRKEEQKAINSKVIAIYEKAMEQLPQISHSYLNKRQLAENGIKRLRSCQAWVWATEDYYVLQSYGTLVAVIEKSTDTCYDALRYVYGYTSTSAQHIAKFRHDYGAGKWGCEKELRYQTV